MRGRYTPLTAVSPAKYHRAKRARLFRTCFSGTLALFPRAATFSLSLFQRDDVPSSCSSFLFLCGCWHAVRISRRYTRRPKLRFEDPLAIFAWPSRKSRAAGVPRKTEFTLRRRGLVSAGMRFVGASREQKFACNCCRLALLNYTY